MQKRPHLTKDELRYFGKNACIALWKARPNDVIRVYVRRDLEREYTELTKWCSAQRKAFHVVENEDLEKLTDSMHHQGICVVAKEKKSLRLENFLEAIKREERVQALFLDGVQNPHNLGAILRTAAHFGMKYIIGEKSNVPRLSPSANRTSEGGAECVELVRIENAGAALQELKKKNFTIYASAMAHNAYSVYETRFAPRSIIVMGNEVNGVSSSLLREADFIVRIPGSDAVESLNVSVAAGIFLSEFYRQSQTGTKRIIKS